MCVGVCVCEKVWIFRAFTHTNKKMRVCICVYFVWTIAHAWKSITHSLWNSWNTLYFSTIRFPTLHYITRHYTTLNTTRHYTSLHHTTLHHTYTTTLHYTRLLYATLHHTSLHCTTLHYTTLHYIPVLGGTSCVLTASVLQWGGAVLCVSMLCGAVMCVV
jgi:hypothetical protein